MKPLQTLVPQVECALARQLALYVFKKLFPLSQAAPIRARQHVHTVFISVFNFLNPGRWTADEHGVFLACLRAHGRNWQVICDALPSRTLIQVRTHAQKYFIKLEKVRVCVVYRTLRVNS